MADATGLPSGVKKLDVGDGTTAILGDELVAGAVGVHGLTGHLLRMNPRAGLEGGRVGIHTTTPVVDDKNNKQARNTFDAVHAIGFCLVVNRY